ncbi:MAG TPA: exo-alpha-sialidase, partial [Glycomyces sp.]|nr:exo-alpha-sialidase [Glycomyces sp.]
SHRARLKVKVRPPSSLCHREVGGRTFTFNRALWDHPDHETWGPGGGGAAVHTIVPDPADPDTVTIAMSAGGIYQTRDAGRTWTGVTKGITVDYGPDPEPASGQCIHKVARDAEGTFFVQSHGPAYRSTDPAEGWTNISAGLPSDFGFHITAHPTRPGVAMAYPVSDAMDRFPPEHRIRAWRTDDAGDTWQPWGTGLPQEPYFGIVLRDAACHDGAADPAWYFGTRCGDVWAAADTDGQWHRVASHLPDVLCVRAMETH